MIRLLLIEDNEVDRRLLKRTLVKTDLGAELFVAEDAEEGLELAINKEFDCILLDCLLPKLNGIQLLKELLKTSAGDQCPVVMLTGAGGDKEAMEALRAGAQDFIPKDGLTPAQLSRAVINAMERHNLRLQIRKSQQALLEKTEHFQSVLNTVGDAIIEIDIEGRIKSQNKAGADLFGYSNKEIAGQKFSLLFAEKGKGGQAHDLTNDLAGGAATFVGKGPVEVVGVSKSGKYISMELVVSDLDRGPEKLFVASMRDITKRKSMEARAKETEEQYRVLAENANDIIFLSDRGGNRLYVSPSVKNHLGYDPESLKRKPPHFLLHPESKLSDVDEFKKTVFDQGNVYKCRARYRHKDGHYIWFDHLAAPVFDQDKRVSAAIISSRNITSQLAEESAKLRLGRAVENSPHEFLMIDLRTLALLNGNRGIRQNLGYSPAEMNQLGLLDLYPKETREENAKLLKPLLCGKKSHLRVQTRHLRKDRSTYDVEILFYAQHQEDPPVLLAYIEDISGKLAVAEKASYAQKMKTIGTLTGDLAHDFNNYLTAILGSLLLLEKAKTKLAQEEREIFNLAVQSAERCADLLRALLAFSERQHLKWAVIEVNDFMREFQFLIRAAIDESIEIDSHFSTQKLSIEVDTEALKNALLNLADNARKAMPLGGNLTIEVALKNLMERGSSEKMIKPGQYVVISISDNGVGMTPEILERIFEPFYTTREPGEGSGLGLSAVFGFMKQMGGAVTVYSEPAKGSTFRLYFPAAKTKRKPGRKKKTKSPGLAKQELTILVVEDEPEVREFVTKALNSQGYQVLVAEDGPRALKVIKKSKKIDLLLCDVILPAGVIGPDIGKQFRKKFPGAGILYTSGYTGKSLEKKDFKINSENLLAKPYNLNEMFERVSAALCSGDKKK